MTLGVHAVTQAKLLVLPKGDILALNARHHPSFGISISNFSYFKL
jgi:hypothetical protein